jgi:hypothetical protein
MKDPKSFVKLFDLNVPAIEHLDYYINQLSKTQKYKSIRHFVSLYEDCEGEIGDAYEFRKNKSEEIIDFIKSTNAYNELCYDKNLIDFPTSKSLEYQEGQKYLSIDLRSANWLALKKYDPDHINELGNDYSEFLSKFNLPQVFIHSKYLRQFIFGNVNPKRLIKVQRNLIQELVRKYQDTLQVEGVRNDEVIFTFNEYSEIRSIFDEIDQVRYKTKIFTVERVEDFRIDTSYNIYGEILNKELMGVDGTQFYMKLKQYITGEELDIKDLYFKSGGKRAIWSVDNLKVELC